MGPAMMAVWLVVGLAVLALIVTGTIWLARNMRAPQRPLPTHPEPMELLERRYAAGEIDEDEYLRRRAGLLP